MAPSDSSDSNAYRVITRIATGGMAEVFKAESQGPEEFRKTVAIKRILPELASHAKFTRMFLDEARLAGRIDHRNVVRVFDVGRVGSSYFLVMEFVDGVTVRDVMDFMRERGGRALSPNLALHIAIEMCNGLDWAHHLRDDDGRPLRIVHRDVSPANVLLSRSGGVQIADFGLAKAVSQLEKTDPGVVKGKYGYLAPETASGEDADAKADQFAVGVLLWEMLSGTRLFQGKTDYETIKRVRAAEVPRLQDQRPNVPAAVDRVLARALARDKHERFVHLGAMSRALTEILFEHRLTVSAQDVMTLVANVLGESRGAPVKRLTPAAGMVRPEVTQQFVVGPIAHSTGQSMPPPPPRPQVPAPKPK